MQELVDKPEHQRFVEDASPRPGAYVVARLQKVRANARQHGRVATAAVEVVVAKEA